MPGVDAYQAERKEILEKFGLELAKLRGPRTSQKALGDRARLHRNQIGFMERGEREPGLLTLLILAETLGVPAGQLLEGLPVPRERRPSVTRKGAADRK